MSTLGGINFDVFGVNVRLDYEKNVPTELYDVIESAWGAALAENGPGDTKVELRAGDQDQSMEQLSSSVTMAALSHRSGGPLMFHAAGIAAEDGRVLAFVGPSGRGKTTLSAALAKHYAYVSDETIVVEQDLTVYSYRKPLSLKRTKKPKEQVSPRKLKLKDLPDAPLKLAKLIVLDRREEPVEHPTISRVPLRDAYELLVPETSYLTRMRKPLQRFAALCEAVGGVLKVSYSDAATLIEEVQGLFAYERAEVQWRAAIDDEQLSSPASVDGRDDVRADVRAASGAERTQDAPDLAADPALDAASALASGEHQIYVGSVYDAVEAGDSVVLLGTDSMLRVLTGLGVAVWQLAREPISFDRMTAAIVAQFGEPPSQSAEELLRPILVELIESCVLRLQKRQTQTS